MLSFIQYLAEAKTRPDAMQRFADRALARMRRQPAPAESPLASLRTQSPTQWGTHPGTKYWYHPDTQKLVPVGTDNYNGIHAETVSENPDIFGVKKSSSKNPIHAAIQNGWVRLDSRGSGLTLQGTQTQSHKVIRDHYAATAGKIPKYYVDHFTKDQASHSGMLSGAEQIEHYVDNAGTPPMSAGWQRETDELN